MGSELKNNFVSLKNRVWKTYKTRINTAERLRINNEFIAFLSIYYSAILAAISIINYVNKSEFMEVLTIVLSVIVAILFLFFEGKNYKERYMRMKENYNSINKHYYCIENTIILDEITKEKFEILYDEYIELLSKVENHSEDDYIKYLIEDKINDIDGLKKIKYYFKKYLILFLKGILILLPTTLIFISILQLLY